MVTLGRLRIYAITKLLKKFMPKLDSERGNLYYYRQEEEGT
jgi:hypothetical protein